jgi:hypothetical protein
MNSPTELTSASVIEYSEVLVIFFTKEYWPNEMVTRKKTKRYLALIIIDNFKKTNNSGIYNIFILRQD